MHRYLKKKKNKAYKEKKNNKSKNFFFEIKNSIKLFFLKFQ